MSHVADIVASVSRAAAALDDLEPRVAEALRLWLAGAPFEAALGLAGGWRDVWAAERQAAALNSLTRKLTGSRRAIAERVSEELRRYQSGCWRHDRQSGHRPSGRDGFLRDYLAAGGAVGVETIRKAEWVNEARSFTQAAE